ncbi:MAG TPA: protein kinase, partial [Longimicrobiales bacterium]|nr:protein kinase [Longimicrobiales bacterium]
MAVVYRARDARHDRVVAIKVLRPEIALALGTARFLQEIQLAARLFHPHILMLIDSGAADGLPYYVMPYVDGESLRDWLNREYRLPLEATLTIARQCAAALDYAHAQGVVHRDIKPENILFEAGHAVIADFGIARAVSAAAGERLTRSGASIGTPAYISPEQAAGESEVGPLADVYALGLVVYECLTGHPPFHGGSAASVIARHVTETPAPIRSARPDAPAHVEEAVGRALRKEPSARFASAGELADALAPQREPAGSGLRRRPAAIALAAAVLVLAAAAYAVRDRLGAGDGATLGGFAPGASHRLTQLTFAQGVEQWLSWSADGKQTVHVAEQWTRSVRGGGAQIPESLAFRNIFTRDVATGEQRRITRALRDDIQPAWAPDGKRIAFVRASAANGKLEPSDINGWYNEGGDIWVTELGGGREQMIVQNAFGPVYSPDGRQLAFDAPWSGARRIWISDQAGRNPRAITRDSSEAVVHSEAQWSPDGRLIAFRRIEKAASDIGVVEVATQRIHWITGDNVLDMNPAWSPSGDALYFSSAHGGGVNIWRVAVSRTGERSGQPQQVTTGAGDDVTPALSPDGSRLSFTVRSFDSDVWRLPVDPASGRARARPEAVSRTTRVESRAAWSPDASRIALNSDRDGDMNLWVRDVASGAERKLTRGRGGDYQANWSADGRTIAFFSARSGNADIWAVPAAGGEPVQLTTDRATDTNPFHSPDGKWIAFMSDRRGRLEVWVMNRDGTGQRPVSELRTGGHFILWTADSRALIFVAETPTERQVVQVSVVDGSVTKLPTIESGFHMSWSP